MYASKPTGMNARQLRLVCCQWDMLICGSVSELMLPKHCQHYIPNLVKFKRLDALELFLSGKASRFASISQLTTLRTLSMHGWTATDQGIAAIAKLTRLQEIDFIRCSITAGHLSQLLPIASALQGLCVNACRHFAAPYATVLHMFPRLTHLNLGSMMFNTDQQVAEFDLPDLSPLYLSCCCKEDMCGLASAAGMLRGLTYLELDDWTDTNDWISFVSAVSNLAELKELILFNYSEHISVLDDGNGLLHALGALPALTQLLLNSCPLAYSQVDALARLTPLRELGLCYGDIAMPRLENVLSRTDFQLSALELTRIGGKVSRQYLKAMVSFWPNLATLTLDGNRLLPGALSALSSCTALTSLAIINTTTSYRRMPSGGKLWNNSDTEQLYDLNGLVNLELPSKHQCSVKGLRLLLRKLPLLHSLHAAELEKSISTQLERPQLILTPQIPIPALQLPMLAPRARKTDRVRPRDREAMMDIGARITVELPLPSL